MFAEFARLDNSLFNEFQRLQRDIDTLFGSTVGRANIRGVRAGSFPALNVGSTDDAVYVYVFAPGVDPNTLDVSIQRNVLTVAGERKVASEPGGEGRKSGYHLRERFGGSFRRAVALSDDVDPDKVEAGYKNGILTVKVAKREAVKPRQINVQAA